MNRVHGLLTVMNSHYALYHSIHSEDGATLLWCSKCRCQPRGWHAGFGIIGTNCIILATTLPPRQKIYADAVYKRRGKVWFMMSHESLFLKFSRGESMHSDGGLRYFCFQKYIKINLFYFLKIIFNINILKWSKNIFSKKILKFFRMWCTAGSFYGCGFKKNIL